MRAEQVVVELIPVTAMGPSRLASEVVELNAPVPNLGSPRPGMVPANGSRRKQLLAGAMCFGQRQRVKRDLLNDEPVVVARIV